MAGVKSWEEEKLGEKISERAGPASPLLRFWQEHRSERDGAQRPVQDFCKEQAAPPGRGNPLAPTLISMTVKRKREQDSQSWTVFKKKKYFQNCHSRTSPWFDRFYSTAQKNREKTFVRTFAQRSSQKNVVKSATRVACLFWFSVQSWTLYLKTATETSDRKRQT